MILLLKFLIFVSFLFTSVDANDFQDIIKMSLKKDEQKEIFVKYGNSSRSFKIRWTLYTNEGLVVFHSYDRRVAQSVLYLNNRNQSFRVDLKTKGADAFMVPYLLVKFKEFDFKQNKALFEIFLSDKKSQVGLKYSKNG